MAQQVVEGMLLSCPGGEMQQLHLSQGLSANISRSTEEQLGAEAASVSDWPELSLSALPVPPFVWASFIDATVSHRFS